MKRHHALLIVLFGLALIGGVLIAIAIGSHAPHGPVFSVTAVQIGLTDDPQAWAGRTVRVRGIATGCLASRGATALQSCSRWPAFLVDAGEAGALPLAWGGQDAMPAFLRRAPLVSGLVSPPRTPIWGIVATYRVQLRTTVCSVAPCYEALLIDATAHP